MQWFLQWTESATCCPFFITDDVPFIWPLITAAPSYASHVIKYDWIWLESRNVSSMTGARVLWSMFKYLRHNNKICLFEYLSVTLSAIIAKYFVSSAISLIFIWTNFAVQVMISFWIFAEYFFAFFGPSSNTFQIAMKLLSLTNGPSKFSLCVLRAIPCLAQIRTKFGSKLTFSVGFSKLSINYCAWTSAPLWYSACACSSIFSGFLRSWYALLTKIFLLISSALSNSIQALHIPPLSSLLWTFQEFSEV